MCVSELNIKKQVFDRPFIVEFWISRVVPIYFLAVTKVGQKKRDIECGNISPAEDILNGSGYTFLNLLFKINYEVSAHTKFQIICFKK